jgi:hypothetical protein
MGKKILFVYFILLSFYFSCSNQKNEQSKSKEKVNSNEIISEIDKSNKLEQLDTKLIQGIWYINESSNAIFEIGEDSILYVDNLRSYPYEISKNMLIIDLDGWKSKSLILRADRDSLILQDVDDQSIIRLFKME